MLKRSGKTAKFGFALILVFALAIMLVFLPGELETSPNPPEKTAALPLEPTENVRMYTGQEHRKKYIATLEYYALSAENAALYITDLEHKRILSAVNDDSLFNPASIIKLMTTSYALKQWPVDYRFSTSFMLPNGSSPERTISTAFLYTDGDPLMRRRDLQMAANRLRKAGIRTIRDSLVVSALFKVNALHDERDTRYVIAKVLRLAGVRLKGPVIIRDSSPQGYWPLVKSSTPKLIDILYEINAHSINSAADRLGEAFGGADSLRKYLKSLPGFENDFRIESCSGLGINRFTPKQITRFLAYLYDQTRQLGIPVSDLIPAMGRDGSTVANRMRQMRFRETILAKTGTLIATDEGVSAIAGYINTGDYGIVPFCIMNRAGEVSFFIKQQNRLMRNFLTELGTDLIRFPPPKTGKFYLYGARNWVILDKVEDFVISR